MTLPSTLKANLLYAPPSRSFIESRQNVENVVYAPTKPTPIASFNGSDMMTRVSVTGRKPAKKHAAGKVDDHRADGEVGVEDCAGELGNEKSNTCA